MAQPGPTLYSVGHGSRPVEELIDLLSQAGVGRLVDVRSVPDSRKHPQFGRDALEASLEAERIDYVWRKDLGGFRKPRPGSIHTVLRSPGFRGYADHMETEEFEVGLTWLIESGRRIRTAFMCAESLWWRCHRRMLSDALLARGCTVLHLMTGGRQDPHRLHPAARIEGRRVLYQTEQPEQQALSG